MMAEDSSKARASERRKAVVEAIRKLTEQAEPSPSACFGAHDLAARKTGHDTPKQEGVSGKREPR